MFAFLRKSKTEQKEKKYDPYDIFEENTAERVGRFREAVIEKMRQEMETVFSKSKREPIRVARGFRQELLDSPTKLLEFWQGNKKHIMMEYFGVGGYEYLSYFELRNRCTCRLSIDTYVENGVQIPQEIYDYYEELTAMEAEDAREQLQKIE